LSILPAKEGQPPIGSLFQAFIELFTDFMGEITQPNAE